MYSSNQTFRCLSCCTSHLLAASFPYIKFRETTVNFRRLCTSHLPFQSYLLCSLNCFMESALIWKKTAKCILTIYMAGMLSNRNICFAITHCKISDTTVVFNDFPSALTTRQIESRPFRILKLLIWLRSGLVGFGHN